MERSIAGIRIKPGRPLRWNNSPWPVFCIPGNPVAVYTYQLLVSDALRVLAGGVERLPRFPVTCGFDVKHKPGRTDFIRATLTMPDAGLPVAMPHGRFGAGVPTSITGADGLLEISAESGNIKEGDMCHLSFFVRHYENTLFCMVKRTYRHIRRRYCGGQQRNRSDLLDFLRQSVATESAPYDPSALLLIMFMLIWIILFRA